MSTRESAVALAAVTQEIVALVATELGTLDVTPDGTLRSWGLDSLKVMSLVFKLEQHYDIVLDEEDADDLWTVDELAALVLRRIEERP